MHQPVVVVIGFHRDVLTSPHVRHQFVRPRTQIRNDRRSLTTITGHEPHVVRPCMGYRNGQNGQIRTNFNEVEGFKERRHFRDEVQFKSGSLVGQDGYVPFCLKHFGSTAVVAVVVGKKEAIDVLWCELQACQPLHQLGAAEPLVDEHFRTRRFQQR